MTINNITDIITCTKTGRCFDNRRSYINHIRNVYKGETLESIFLQETQSQHPRCVFCEEPCKFKSLQQGFFDYCNSRECKIKSLTISNRILGNKRAAGIPGYDNIILQHRDLFASAFMGNVIIDPYDGRVHDLGTKNNLTRYITSRSETSILGEQFFEPRICKCCGKEFLVNFIRTPTKFWCSGKCASILNIRVGALKLNNSVKHRERKQSKLDYIKNLSIIKFSELCANGSITTYPIELRCLTDKFSVFVSFQKLRIHTIIDAYTELYCNISSYRSGVLYNATLSALYKSGNLSIYEYTQGRLPDLRICDVCGNSIISKYNWHVDENYKLVEPKEILHSYCSQSCYFKFLKSGGKTERYGYSEERKLTQSNKLKVKILNGEFTPNSTNSWCYGRIQYNGISFRSSWELIFYHFAIHHFTSVAYEKVRIPYLCTQTNKLKIYIVDFLADDTLVEVKPKSEMNKSKDKFEALYQYATDNNLNVIICDETYIRDVIGVDYVSNVLTLNIPDSIKTRISRLKRGLFNDNIKSDFC